MKTWTIRNDFHNTECRVRTGGDGRLSQGQKRRVRKTLCGIEGCTCGGELSERGRQECEIGIDCSRDGEVTAILRPLDSDPVARACGY